MQEVSQIKKKVNHIYHDIIGVARGGPGGHVLPGSKKTACRPKILREYLDNYTEIKRNISLFLFNNVKPQQQ
tara:strand:- start:166 stop:381 length:216 start_codon:yes stop_codon:yes gene_type:complete